MVNISHSTEEFFDLFSDEARGWLHRLGLMDWQTSLTCRDDIGDDAACCFVHEMSRIAEISLNSEWDIEPDEWRICLVAFHEACELMLSDVEDIGNRESSSPSEMRKAVHAVIRRLENTLFDGYWKAKQQGKVDAGKLRPCGKRPGRKDKLNG